MPTIDELERRFDERDAQLDRIEGQLEDIAAEIEGRTTSAYATVMWETVKLVLGCVLAASAWNHWYHVPDWAGWAGVALVFWAVW